MNRKRIIIAAAIIVLTLLAGPRALRGGDSQGDNKEPERGGPPIIALDNTYKLNALLPPPLFFAVKDDISTYIVSKVSVQARTATVDTTRLNPDGSIDVDILVSNGKSFVARVSQPNDRLVFTVPSSHYTVTQDIGDIEVKYGGDY